MIYTDDELEYIFANAPVEKDWFEVFEISCEWFSKTYYIQSVLPDVDVTLEDGTTVVTAEYVPMTATTASSNDDMSYERGISLQYVNDAIAAEIDLRDPLLHKGVYPKITSRCYVMYRDGSVSLIKGKPISTHILEVTRDEQAATFNTSLTPTDRQSTGEMTTTTRVPMLEPYL